MTTLRNNTCKTGYPPRRNFKLLYCIYTPKQTNKSKWITDINAKKTIRY